MPVSKIHSSPLDRSLSDRLPGIGRRVHSGSPKDDGRNRASQAQVTGRLRGELTTEIVGLADALGNLVHFLLLPGQAHDMKGAMPLIEDISFNALLANKVYEADWQLRSLNQHGATAAIPPKANRRVYRDYD